MNWFDLDLSLSVFFQEGKHFQNVVFNQTINLTEADEGFDGETWAIEFNRSIIFFLWIILSRFFLYVFLVAVLLLLGFVVYQYLLSNRLKRTGGKQNAQAFLANQQAKGSYDPDWIPKHHLASSKLTNKQKRNNQLWFQSRSFTTKKSKSTKISPNNN